MKNKLTINKNKTLTVGESSLIGFIYNLLEPLHEPRKTEKTEDFERLLKRFDLNFCVATGNIIK